MKRQRSIRNKDVKRLLGNDPSRCNPLERRGKTKSGGGYIPGGIKNRVYMGPGRRKSFQVVRLRPESEIPDIDPERLGMILDDE